MSTDKLTFRIADKSEAAELADLINRAFVVEKPFFSTDRITLDETLSHFRKGKFLVVADGGDMAGCNYVELRGDSGYFGLLSIDPSYQGRGLGKDLVLRAEQICREAGCLMMRIRVLNHRTELPPFYEKLGYARAGLEEVEQEASAIVPYHFIVMEKLL